MKRSRDDEDFDEASDLDDDEAPRRIGWLGVLLLLSAVPLVCVAIATLSGVGLARSLPGFPAVVGGLALVLLPIAGLAALVAGSARWPGTVGGSAWFWSLTILLALPFYFPGERLEAGAAGLRFLVAPVGEGARESLLRIGDGVLGLLGSEPEKLPEAVAVPPKVAASEGPPKPPLRKRTTDEVVLPYDGDGQIMRVSVFFDGPRYGDEFPMIFDTGATYTTLNRDALALLEVDVPSDAPVAVLRTANGEIEAPLVLIDAAWLGDAVVEWVTVAVCDPCAAGEVAGLLGLNVSGQFQISLDHEGHEIRLSERGEASERRLDVAQWVGLSSRVRRWRDGRVEVEVTLGNRSPVDIREATALVACVDASFEVAVPMIPAFGSESARMSLPNDTDCSEYRLELASARWKLDRF